MGDSPRFRGREIAGRSEEEEVEVVDQYIGEIRLVPYTFAPVGWALCDGHLLPINQNQAPPSNAASS